MQRRNFSPKLKKKQNEDLVEKLYINLEINIIDNGLGISEQGLK